jgi:hypothetical protein
MARRGRGRITTGSCLTCTRIKHGVRVNAQSHVRLTFPRPCHCPPRRRPSCASSIASHNLSHLSHPFVVCVVGVASSFPHTGKRRLSSSVVHGNLCLVSSCVLSGPALGCRQYLLVSILPFMYKKHSFCEPPRPPLLVYHPWTTHGSHCHRLHLCIQLRAHHHPTLLQKHVKNCLYSLKMLRMPSAFSPSTENIYMC